MNDWIKHNENNDSNENFEDIDFLEDKDDDMLNEDDMLKVLDPDLVEYFNEARLLKKKPNGKAKKKKKEKVIYEIGTKIKFKNNFYIILYGPYEVDNKTMYEVESEDGNIISVDDRYINI